MIFFTIALNPTEECLYSNKGTCEKCLKKYKLAIKDYKLSLEINQKNTKNLKRLSSVYIIVGNFGEALMLLEKCVNLEPRNESFKSELEKLKTLIEKFNSISDIKEKGEWEKLEEVCEHILKEASSYTDLKIEYIKVLIKNGKNDKAIKLMNELEEEKTNSEILYLTALVFYYEGNYDKANKFLKILLTKSSNDSKYLDLDNKIKKIPTLKDKANQLFKEGKYEEAIEEYTKILDFDPDNRKYNSIIYANRSLCYQKLKKNTEALKDSNKCLQLNPNYVRGYIKRASVYKDLNMYEEAKFDYQKAKELDPSNTEVIGLLEEAKKLESKARKRDYYKILDVDRNASEQEIKKAYRKMAAKYHPDRNSESEETKKMAEKKFIDVNDAYNVLSDPKKKSMYDQGIDPLNPEEQGGMNFSSAGIDLSDILNMFGGGMGGMGGNSGGTHFTFSTGGGPGGFSFGFPGSSGGSSRSGGSRRAGGGSSAGFGGFPFEMFFGGQ